MEYLMT